MQYIESNVTIFDKLHEYLQPNNCPSNFNAIIEYIDGNKIYRQ